MIIGIDIRLIGKKRTGDEAVFFNLTKELAKIDRENQYKLFTDIIDAEILQNIGTSLEIEGNDNFEIVSLKSKNKFTWNFWDLQKYLRENQIDVYLTQYITPFFVPKKIKIVTIIHDISFNFFPQFIKFSDLFFLKTLIPLSLKRANKVVGVSRFTADEIVKYYKISSNKVDFIHNAVNDDFIQKVRTITPQEIEKIKDKYKLPEKFVLYLGTFQPRKNIPTLIKAYSLIKPDFENLKLVLAGGKGYNYDPEIDAAISKNKIGEDVFFPGYINEDDKAALMASAEIFVFPSFYEGFGIPVLEAINAKVPVVASDIVPLKEVVSGAALFFNPKSPEELGEKIKKVMNDEKLREDLVQKGAIQSQKFSWSGSAQKLLKIFTNLE